MSSNSNQFSRRQFVRTGGEIALATSLLPSAAVFAQDAGPKIPAPPSKKTGWAIVGLGTLALDEILPAFALTESCKPVALVSGHRDKAEKTAAHYGINPKSIYSYDNFEQLRDNAEVDVVYIVLPNSMHAEFTTRALAMGKHVLCEKPMATSVAECQAMIDASKKVWKKLMIAYRLHYEPFNQAMIAMSRQQVYGKIKTIDAENLQDTRPPNIRLQKALGGGPLGDVGVYCINAFRYITGEEPIEVFGSQHQPADDPRFKEVPETVTFEMKFPSGILAHGSASFGCRESRRFRVNAERGWYELENAFTYTNLKMMVFDGHGTSQIALPQVNHFAMEMDHFSNCVKNDTAPWTGGEEGLADQKVMTAIEQSISSGQRVKM